MFKWAQGAVASAMGTAEPEYGASAFMAVDKTVSGRNPYGKLERRDLEWQQPSQSHVETQTFYFHDASSGIFGFVQVIHSNPVNVMFTSQFTCLIVNTKDPNYKVWKSVNMSNFTCEGANAVAEQGFKITLNAENNEYHFTNGNIEPSVKIDFKFKLVDRGFKIGADGVSRYGTDLAQPWGTMRHVFWPRAVLDGSLEVEGKNFFFKDTSSMFVMALQGMKPHHAAARWNFLNFQGPTTSMITMEFETPASYGRSRSSIGAVVKDGKLIATGVGVDIKHIDAVKDEVGWPAPKAIEFKLEGPSPDSTSSTATVVATAHGKLDRLVARMDVMAELPAFVKKVASGISGTNPFIYVYNNPMTIELEIDGTKFSEEGTAYNEATFIS